MAFAVSCEARVFAAVGQIASISTSATMPSSFSVLLRRLGLRFPAGSISTTTLDAHQLSTGFSGCTSLPETTSRSIVLLENARLNNSYDPRTQ